LPECQEGTSGNRASTYKIKSTRSRQEVKMLTTGRC